MFQQFSNRDGGRSASPRCVYSFSVDASFVLIISIMSRNIAKTVLLLEISINAGVLQVFQSNALLALPWRHHYCFFDISLSIF